MYSLSAPPRMHVDGVLQEHVARASELLALLRSPSFEFRDGDVANDIWRRCDANLDALRIAGEPAILIAEAAMKDDPDAASVVALLSAEYESNDSAEPSRAQQAVSLLRHESPETRHAAWFGLRLARSTNTQPRLTALAREPVCDVASAAALDILAFQRQPTPEPLALNDPPQDSEIAWLLAEAAGRMRGAWSATHLERFLSHPSRRVREAALRASARCGLGELHAICRAATEHATPLEAIEFLGVVGSHEDLSLLQRAASVSATARSGVIGLGRLGLVTAMPTLLYLLDEPELVEIAAAAITRITGEELPRTTAPQPPPGLSEDDLDLWEPIAPVDAPRAHEWWASRAPRFDLEKRYQSGVCVSDDPLGPASDQLPLGIRLDLYLRQRALDVATPDWELETWPWKHKSPHGLPRPSRLTN